MRPLTGGRSLMMMKKKKDVRSKVSVKCESAKLLGALLSAVNAVSR